MPRALLDESNIHPAIRSFVAESQQAIVAEVQAAVAKYPVVVVGMGFFAAKSVVDKKRVVQRRRFMPL